MVHTNSVAELLRNLYEFGVQHDTKTGDRVRRMLNITPDTGLFLSILLRATKAKNVLEVGTSDGYSTIWIADALRQRDGKVVTLEVSPEKGAMARRNFKRSGLSKHIEFHQEDARDFLANRRAQSFDLVFLDAERTQYVTLWKDVDRVLRVGGLLIVDNATSPKPEELTEFFELVKSDRYLSQIVQVGKGEMIAVKLRTRRA